MSHTSVNVFAIVAGLVWITMLVWAFGRRKDPNQWFYFWVLGIGVVFWWLGESVALRLGKYEYAMFPFAIPGGSPATGDWLGDIVKQYLIPDGEAIEGCLAESWSIPFPVLALEASLIFSFLRLADLRLVRTGWKSALATAGMSGLLLINLTAILDPVVSTSFVCSAGNPPAPGASVLTFGVWHWFTNTTHQGYWFGVPLVNYSAWFLAAFVFNFLVRLDGEGPGGLIRRYKTWFGWIAASVAFLVILFLLLIPLKYGVDRVIVHGQSMMGVVDARTWQFAVLGVLLAVLGVLPIVLFGRLRRPARVDWIACVPQLAVYAYCGGALLVQPHGTLIAIWLVSFALASLVMFWPYIAPYMDTGARARGENISV